jgi:hypothetical protein
VTTIFIGGGGGVGGNVSQTENKMVLLFLASYSYMHMSGCSCANSEETTVLLFPLQYFQQKKPGFLLASSGLFIGNNVLLLTSNGRK